MTFGTPALVTSDGYAGAGDLDARVRCASAELSAKGVRRVAIDAPNSVAAVVGILAAIHAGIAVVPIHPRLLDHEKADLIARSRADLVLDEALLAALSRSTAVPLDRAEIDPSATLAVVFTSGTSGRPKAAVLSRRAFAASATASAANLAWLDDDRWLLCMPLCHVGGLSILTRCALANKTIVLVSRFDPEAVLASIERDAATMLSVVPTMLRALLESDRRDALARLRVVLVGGAAAPHALLEECARRRVRVATTYGLTEACSQVTAQRPRNPSAIERGAGKPLLGMDVRVVDEAILVRGPTLMDGYEDDTGAIDPARDADGFFDTGDVGALDEAGNLHVHARRTDLVVTGGENVYPVEVEAALEGIRGVRRALVFGVPDDRWGAVVAAAIEIEPSVEMSAIASELRRVLAPHKRPRRVAVVASLATTSAGKLERKGALDRYGAALLPIG